MKTLSPLTLGLIALVFTAAAQAQVYQWKDANGRTVVSDNPPPGNIKNSNRLGSPSSAPLSPAASAPPTKSLNDRDMDFKKRQQETKEKGEKADKEQAATAERQDNCRRARQSLATLESGQRVSSTNEKGEREFMDDDQRQAEMARARKVIDDSCK